MSRLNLRLLWLVVSLLAALSLWYGASYAFVPSPYYRVYMYTIEPPVVCPGEGVESWADRQIYDFQFLHRGSYTLGGEWFNPKTLQTEGIKVVGGTLVDNEVGRDTKLSPWIRIAPSSPGKWRLRLVMTLHGKVLGLPRQWMVPYESNDLLTVRNSTDKECMLP